MLTEAQAHKAGYQLVRGTFQPPSDDRLDRWYWESTDSTRVDRRGREQGFETKRAALESLSAALNVENETALDLRAAREQLGLTQAQAAERLGVTENTWARWERGEMRVHPARLRDIERLAHKAARKR